MRRQPYHKRHNRIQIRLIRMSARVLSHLIYRERNTNLIPLTDRSRIPKLTRTRILRHRNNRLASPNNTIMRRSRRRPISTQLNHHTTRNDRGNSYFKLNRMLSQLIKSNQNPGNLNPLNGHSRNSIFIKTMNRRHFSNTRPRHSNIKYVTSFTNRPNRPHLRMIPIRIIRTSTNTFSILIVNRMIGRTFRASPMNLNHLQKTLLSYKRMNIRMIPNRTRRIQITNLPIASRTGPASNDES